MAASQSEAFILSYEADESASMENNHYLNTMRQQGKQDCVNKGYETVEAQRAAPDIHRIIYGTRAKFYIVK